MIKKNTPLLIYTDGACSGNPGPGGWAALLKQDNHVLQELVGSDANTTNNRMELMAVIKALEFAHEHHDLILHMHTDSRYVMDGIQNWLPRWQANGWRTAQNKPVKNQDLWEELYALSKGRQIEWTWLKGHSGHPENERADLLAKNAILKELMAHAIK